jgi:hypothetical protein
LGEFAAAAGADRKWVLNAQAQLGLKPKYDRTRLIELGLTRILVDEGLGLADAHRRARTIVAREAAGDPWEHSVTGLARVYVDRERFYTRLALGLARARALAADERRGRPRRMVKDAAAEATRYGVDLSLLDASLRRTPAERLRRLDQDVEFLRSLRVRSP